MSRWCNIIVTFLRSSSVSGFGFCQQQYFIGSVLGHSQPSGKAAQKGNVVHKALELLARKKLATQLEQRVFADPETERRFETCSFKPTDAFDEAYGFYTCEKNTTHRWSAKDQLDCEQWFSCVLTFDAGRFNPLNQEIVEPELYFDVELDRPWSRYSYALPDGQVVEGNLAIRGTVDLVTRLRPGILHYVDYKTGQRKDWGTGKAKTLEALCDDFQMLLYYYALRLHFPDDVVVMTIYYIRDGGPFTLPIGDEDLGRTEELIRAKFEEIRNCERPRILSGHDLWKCQRLCAYYKEPLPGSTKPACKEIAEQVVSLGIDRVTAKFGKSDAFCRYGDGGGVANRDGRTT